MPPFEGFDPTNLRQGTSLYDNLLDDVQTYSSELKERFHISFQSHQEDVVATRDIIVGNHPLYEPGTPEWERFVLGKDAPGQDEAGPLKNQQIKSNQSLPQDEPKKRQRPNEKTPPQNCSSAADVMEWVEIFTGLCMAPKNASRECARWTDVDKTESPPEDSMGEILEEEKSASQPDLSALKSRVLYPIAKYPSRLDSERLVEQRRKFIENRVNFKPLRLERRIPRKPKKV